jgi:hypothetical protein
MAGLVTYTNYQSTIVNLQSSILPLSFVMLSIRRQYQSATAVWAWLKFFPEMSISSLSVATTRYNRNNLKLF